MCTHWYNFYVERSSLSSAEPHVVLYLTAEELTHAFNSHKFVRWVSPEEHVQSSGAQGLWRAAGCGWSAALGCQVLAFQLIEQLVRPPCAFQTSLGLTLRC